MKAQIIAVGQLPRYQSFFDIDCEFLINDLAGLGITSTTPILMEPIESRLFEAVQNAAGQSSVILILAAPQPEVMDTINAAVSRGLSLPLVVREEELGHLQEHAMRTKNLLTSKELQAFATVPQGAIPLDGYTGLVPGYAIASRRQLMVVLPASPSELTQVFGEKVREILRLGMKKDPPANTSPAPKSPAVGGLPMAGPLDADPGAPKRVPIQRGEATTVLKAVGLGEIPVPQLLERVPRPAGLTIEATQDRGDWTIRLTARDLTSGQAEALCRRAAESARDVLGTCYYSNREESLGQAAVRALESARIRVTLADGCTDGLLGTLLKGVAGSGKVAAVVPAASDRDYRALNIPRKLLDETDPASKQGAIALARGAGKLGKTNLGAAIVASAGLVYVAVADGEEAWVKTLNIRDADGPTIRNLACLQAFHMLRLYAHHYPNPLPGGISLGTKKKKKGRKLPSSPREHDGKENTFMSKFAPRKKATAGGLTPAQAAAAARPRSAQSTNLLQRIRTGRLDKSDWLRLSVVFLCLVIFVISIVYIISVKLESVNYLKDAQSLADSYYNQTVTRNHVVGFPASYNEKFASLWAQNEDVAGWIKIPNTTVDYVVVQTSDNEYYERRDFTGASNQHGVPFVDYRIGLREPSTNTVIYGHNMDDGQIFGPLLGYKSLAYYQQNPLITFDSVYHDGEYKIFGAVLCKKDDPDFRYHNFINKDELEGTGFTSLADYVSKIRERSLINTKVDVVDTDTILTLSTCDYSFKSDTGDRIARMVIFARKVRQGESSTVDTAGATLNTNPVMPAEWYTALAKKQAAELQKQQEEEAKRLLNEWLTTDEQKNLSDADKQTVANQRKADAQKYLTYDEQESLDIYGKISLISERKSDFAKWLTSEEQGWSSVSKRISTVAQRKVEAALYLTSSEISSARNWEAIEALINERKNSQADFAKWLTQAERNSTSTTTAQKAQLVAERKAQATAAGLTAAEIANASSWEEILALINSKQANAALLALVNANPKWLTSADITAGATEATLNQLMASRKQQATDAGVNPNSYSTWAQIQQAINDALAAQKATYIAANAKWIEEADKSKTLAELQALVANRQATVAAAKAELGSTVDTATGKTYATILDERVAAATTWAQIQTAISDVKAQAAQAQQNQIKTQIETFYNSNSPKWLTAGEKPTTYTQAVLNELQSLVTSRKAQAQAAGIDVSLYTTWEQILAAINAPPPPSSSSSSEPPPSSSSSSEPPSSSSSETGNGSSSSAADPP